MKPLPRAGWAPTDWLGAVLCAAGCAWNIHDRDWWPAVFLAVCCWAFVSDALAASPKTDPLNKGPGVE